MSRPPRTAAVEDLLRELGPQLHRASVVEARTSQETHRPGGTPGAGARLSTGQPSLDELLAGGLPRGRLSEIASAPGGAPPSAGRTSLTLSILARATRDREVAALVDLADAFHPESAEERGLVLERLLWVRPPDWRSALRCSEQLLTAGGFALVVLDGAQPPQREATTTRPSRPVRRARPKTAPASRPGPSSNWAQLARAAAGSGTALLLLSRERLAGSHAEVALELGRVRARFTGSPPLLTSFETEIALVRHRSLAPRTTSLRLSLRAA